MSRPEVTGRRPGAFSLADSVVYDARGPPWVEAYTLKEFCEAHRISPAFFYQLRRLGLAPRVMRGLGSKQIISGEEAARWRRERTEAAAHSESEREQETATQSA
jgi:hypothetical protein